MMTPFNRSRAQGALFAAAVFFGAAGFAKARLLAQGKILAYAGLETLETAGLETVFERREAPEHYLAVVAAPEAALPRCGLRGIPLESA